MAQQPHQQPEDPPHHHAEHHKKQHLYKGQQNGFQCRGDLFGQGVACPLHQLGQGIPHGVGQEIHSLHGGSQIAAGLGHGGFHLFGHRAADKLLIDGHRQAAAGPDGHPHAHHGADQFGQTCQKSLAPAGHRRKGKHDQKYQIIDPSHTTYKVLSLRLIIRRVRSVPPPGCR